MKILKKEVKDCEDTASNKMKVLDLHYSHKGKEWRILVRDFIEDDFKNVLKQLRVAVRNSYNKENWKA